LVLETSGHRQEKPWGSIIGQPRHHTVPTHVVHPSHQRHVILTDLVDLVDTFATVRVRESHPDSLEVVTIAAFDDLVHILSVAGVTHVGHLQAFRQLRVSILAEPGPAPLAGKRSSGVALQRRERFDELVHIG
jgi:hypothetical protein